MMKGKTMLGVLGLAGSAVLALVLLLASGGSSGEYHVSTTLLCFDCHTAHFSMQHGWGGTTPVPTTPQPGGNWLGTTGPNKYLLKMPVNELCQTCHDGQTFAPDVVGANSNASPSQGRQAGALNTLTLGAPYETWKGHTLDSTATPPGFNPASVGAGANWYDPAGGLECINCHLNHGIAYSYRNLGPRAIGATAVADNFRPTYHISTTNDTTRDVWINLPGYTAGSGVAATFSPFYDRANIAFNRLATGTTIPYGLNLKTSNRLGSFCAACHADFHGGPGNPSVDDATSGYPFIRHPTAEVIIGAIGGGHSNLSRYVNATNKVQVAASTHNPITEPTPICVSCHKAHGNQNPFGLIFMARTTGTPGEEGTTTDVNIGIRNLCGQCHVQGN